MAGIDYYKVSDIDSYLKALEVCKLSKKAIVIECVVDAKLMFLFVY